MKVCGSIKEARQPLETNWLNTVGYEHAGSKKNTGRQRLQEIKKMSVVTVT